MLGDLKHGRTVHSLALLAARLTKPPRLAFVAPPSLSMPTEVTASLTVAAVQVSSTARALRQARRRRRRRRRRRTRRRRR